MAIVQLNMNINYITRTSLPWTVITVSMNSFHMACCFVFVLLMFTVVLCRHPGGREGRVWQVRHRQESRSTQTHQGYRSAGCWQGEPCTPSLSLGRKSQFFSTNNRKLIKYVHIRMYKMRFKIINSRKDLFQFCE